ncbi:NAD(P)/FAD-dependent oxidoreductase [Rhodococcus sp. USK10]|uniref:flavin-containing monooxygenase n=1 Tax=Rhodococcus TaxID=1827 RepID=UPI000F5879E4|nr:MULTISPECIES: NAD(P)/FAD-dependent oxidoreductase [Rhodococcus]QYB04709.1 NAD(P)/FAD-dependent oxidoreductase [Rhodococcus sp. USK10]
MTTNQVRQGAERWLGDFETALATRSSDKLAQLLLEESFLRDNGALTWDFRQFHGRIAVEKLLWSVVDDIKPANLRISEEWPAPHVEGKGESAVIEVFFDFDTDAGSAVGLLHGAPDDSSPYGFKARAIYTRLESLKGTEYPEAHPRGHGYTPERRGENWLQHRERERSFEDRDPEVLIVGSGQAGLMTAAHLTQLGVTSLIIDKHERVGDNWRKRYHSLNLHNPIEMNHFPYLPFPDHYPEYLPKDVIANWLEIYARYLDLDIWTSTEFEGADYDYSVDSWSATVRRSDGTTRALRPKHIVLATGGIGGKPNIPKLPGLDSFTGETMHSSEFGGGEAYAGKKAVVVGVGSSAHDIALDLHQHGATVTMVQRSPVIINNVETANLAYAAYFDGTPAELVDIRYGVGLINPLRFANSQTYHQFAKERDAELLRGLELAGLRLGDGFEGAGWLDLFLRTGGGYYLNVGASEVIVSGGIKVLQADRIDEFVPQGVRLDDGGVLDADLVVLATGYQNRKTEVAQQFGEEVAERVGEIAGLDEEGEWANVWRPTAQRGLWFNGGGINQVRPASRRLALLIKGDLNNLIPDSLRRDVTPGRQED